MVKPLAIVLIALQVFFLMIGTGFTLLGYDWMFATLVMNTTALLGATVFWVFADVHNM